MIPDDSPRPAAVINPAGSAAGPGPGFGSGPRPDPDPRRPPPTTSRLTVVGTVFCQSPRGRVTAVETRFSRIINKDEQSYSRELTADEEWRPLPTGWVPTAAHFVLENREAPLRPREPEDLNRIIELSCRADPPGASWEIRPGEDMRGTPRGMDDFRVRCPRGVARFLLTLIPGE
jgi:hypothetical protein